MNVLSKPQENNVKFLDIDNREYNFGTFVNIKVDRFIHNLNFVNSLNLINKKVKDFYLDKYFKLWHMLKEEFTQENFDILFDILSFMLKEDNFCSDHNNILNYYYILKY